MLKIGHQMEHCVQNFRFAYLYKHKLVNALCKRRRQEKTLKVQLTLGLSPYCKKIELKV